MNHRHLPLKSIAAILLAGSFAAFPAGAATKIGVTAAVNPNATGLRPAETVRILVLGEDIVQNERITTDDDALVQLLMIDGTTMTIGPRASLVIDEYVYDPNAGIGKLTLSFAKGTMRFVGGIVSKRPDAVNIITPIGAIGIRGWAGVIDVTDFQVKVIMDFGKKTTFTANGKKTSTYKAGTMITATASDSGVKTNVSTATGDDIARLTSAVSGARGTGGSPNLPTDRQVHQTVSPFNSNKPPAVLQNAGQGAPITGGTGPDQSAPWKPLAGNPQDTADIISDLTATKINEEIANANPPPPIRPPVAGPAPIP